MSERQGTSRGWQSSALSGGTSSSPWEGAHVQLLHANASLKQLCSSLFGRIGPRGPDNCPIFYYADINAACLDLEDSQDLVSVLRPRWQDVIVGG